MVGVNKWFLQIWKEMRKRRTFFQQVEVEVEKTIRSNTSFAPRTTLQIVCGFTVKKGQ
jgi:hypothetical protein